MSFQTRLNHLRDAYQAGGVIVEDDWGFTRSWEPTGFNDDDCWVRGSLDVLEFITPEHAVGEDWKSGKRYPPKHIQQEQLYVVFAFNKFPALQTFDFRFRYMDETGSEDACSTKRTYKRTDVPRLQDGFNRRGLIMTNDYTFKPNPSRVNCRFCDFKDSCEWVAQ